MKMATRHCNEKYATVLRGEYHSNPKRNELFKKAMLDKHADTIKSVGASPWKSLSPLPVSVPLFLSVAAGLRGIDFGGEGLGAIWKDFGEAGMVSAVPVAISNFLYLELSRRDLAKDPNRPRTFMRSKFPFILAHTLNICSFLILTQAPSSVNMFLFVSSVTGLIESKYILRAGGAGSGVLDSFLVSSFNKRIQVTL